MKEECGVYSPLRQRIVTNGVKVLSWGRRTSTSSDEWLGIEHLYPGCIQLGVEASIC